MARDFRELLKRDYVILDGAMGTMLQAAGMKMGETPEMLNITHPELLVSIHEQYLNAGSDVYMPIHLAATLTNWKNADTALMNLSLQELKMRLQPEIMSNLRHW